MTGKAIKYLVWGLLFVLIDLKIVTFDITHDVIGYILIYKGINRLRGSHWLKLAKTSVIFLGIFSIIEIFGLGYINLNELNQDFTFELAAAGVLAILSLFFHMNLLSGLLETANEVGLEEQYSSIRKFQTFYLIFNLLSIMSLPALMMFRENYLMYLVIMMAAGFIVEIVYIVKINSFKRFIHPEEHAS
jgi:hypothetical protein